MGRCSGIDKGSIWDVSDWLGIERMTSVEGEMTPVANEMTLDEAKMTYDEQKMTHDGEEMTYDEYISHA